MSESRLTPAEQRELESLNKHRAYLAEMARGRIAAIDEKRNRLMLLDRQRRFRARKQAED